MPVFNIFSSCVEYKYKTNLCSYGTLVVLLVTTLMLCIPLIIIYQFGGLWLKNDIYTEIPRIVFKQKYLFLAESGSDYNPIICSTFKSYKENPILDSCTVTKAQEIDINKDGFNDVLKFEVRFFSKLSVQSIKLLLFFNYELEEMSEVTMESMAIFDYSSIHNVQKVNIVGDLRLNQKSPLQNRGVHNIYNYSMDINNLSLLQVLIDHASRKLTTKIENSQITWQTGFSADEEFVMQAVLFYSEEVINYQPGIWQEMKWAWIQYISVFFVFFYIAKWLINILFINRCIMCYVVIPWIEK